MRRRVATTLVLAAAVLGMQVAVVAHGHQPVTTQLSAPAGPNTYTDSGEVRPS